MASSGSYMVLYPDSRTQQIEADGYKFDADGRVVTFYRATGEQHHECGTFVLRSIVGWLPPIDPEDYLGE